MPLTLIRRELRGAFVYFIPEGETVDGDVVSSTSWPDGTPTTNYTDWQFTDIETVTESKEVDSETFNIPSVTGGYSRDTEENIFSQTFECVSAKTNSILKQLSYGLTSAAASGVPQKPLAKRDNSINGVLLIEFQGKSGTVLERIQTWSRLRVTEGGNAGSTTSKVTFAFETLDSSLNTYQAN